jgi:hypothetical protein
MPGPPEDVAVSELFQKMLERPRPNEPVAFPALDQPGARGKLRIQVLAKNEHDRARLLAHKKVRDLAQKEGIALTPQDMQSEAVRGTEADLAACEVLAAACLHDKPMPGYSEGDEFVRYGRVFPDGDAVGKVLSADEVAYLFAAYNMVQWKYGPHESICLPEDVNEWVRRLVEGAADNPFLRLSSPQWAELLTALAQRLYALSQVLESQWSSLPDSLKSELQTFCLGTSSAGEQPESSYEPMLPGAKNEVSFEQAMRLALRMRGQPED